MASSDTLDKKLKFSGYAELYYLHSFKTSPSQENIEYLYNFHRNDQFALNLGLVRANYRTSRFRADLGLMAGTYAKQNLATEPKALQNIYEASVGVKLSEKREIWLEAGVFPSHIGAENPIGAEQWTLTRSLLSENSPYYESGLKFSHSPTGRKISYAVFVLQGWQVMYREDFLSLPSFGHQLVWEPDSNFTLTQNTFMGQMIQTDRHFSMKTTRCFHNLFIQWNPKPKFGLMAGLDAGVDIDHIYNEAWVAPILVTRFQFKEDWWLAARTEYFNDISNTIVSTSPNMGFQVASFSINLDKKIHTNALWRIESRLFRAENYIFPSVNGNSRRNSFVGTTLSLSL